MPSINLATQTDLLDIHQLIKQIFLEEKLTQITAQGYKNFLEFITCSSLKKRLAAGSKIWLYKTNIELIGILEINPNNHILLYFVKKNIEDKKLGKCCLIMLEVTSQEESLLTQLTMLCPFISNWDLSRQVQL